METGQISTQSPSPSQDAIDSVVQLHNSINAVFPEAVADFESRWTAVQAVCQSKVTSTSDDSCVQTDEFGSVRKLGPRIIPFVVYKLAIDDTGQNIWDNALENDSTYCVNLDEQDLRSCSARIIELNYQRNKIVETQLWEMGTSIIAPLMVAFNQGQDEYWWDLLHEIVHGHKMGAVQYAKYNLYGAWDTYFRRGEHSQAPDYILTPLDRFVKFGERVDDSAAPRRMTLQQDHLYRAAS